MSSVYIQYIAMGSD